MDNCIFCKIINKEKTEEIIYENDNILVVSDINPKASIHLLVTPKKHYVDYYEMMGTEPELVSKVSAVVKILVEKFNLQEKPYTWGFHCGGKQSVNHVHAQFLSGMKENEYVL